jgi:imidazolonepropionase
MNLIIKNIKQLITVNSHGRSYKAGKEMQELGIIEDATIEIHNGLFSWIGPDKSFVRSGEKDIDVIDASELIALPGFVDSETQMVFAGSYEQDIANDGKVDLSKIVRATRVASKKDLLKSARKHLDGVLKHGTSTVGIKSGLGLNEDSEIRMLDVINELSKESLVDVIPIFFGAHFAEDDFNISTDDYADTINSRLLAYLAKRKLTKFCEVYCQKGYFNASLSEKISESAASLGLRVKIRSDFSEDSGALKLFEHSGAFCASGLESVDNGGLQELYRSGAIATVFPGKSFFMNENYAPARNIIDSDVPLAIASDFNPAFCMSFSIPLMMTIACRQMSLTPEEAITAATLNGAAALGLSDKKGSIEVGKEADIVLYNVPNYLYLLYHFGINNVTKVIKRGTYLDF